MFKKLLITFSFIALASCDSDTKIEGTHDTTGIDMTIRVVTFNNKKALNKHVSKLDGAPSYDVDGLAQWRVDAIGNVKRCDIYVEKPKGKRDYTEQENWGHELMHCVYGSFHEDGER